MTSKVPSRGSRGNKFKEHCTKAPVAWLVTSKVPYCSIQSWPEIRLWTQQFTLLHVYASPYLQAMICLFLFILALATKVISLQYLTRFCVNRERTALPSQPCKLMIMTDALSMKFGNFFIKSKKIYQSILHAGSYWYWLLYMAFTLKTSWLSDTDDLQWWYVGDI